MSLQSRKDLVAKLRSKKYRDAFISSRISNTLALQIRVMRQERGWSQAHLAKLLGTSQNAVYRLESPGYGKPSITTLRRLASIFDVGLAVWFAPFSKLVDRVTNLSTEDILVPSFDDDPGISETEADSSKLAAISILGNNPFVSGSFHKTVNAQKYITIDVSTLLNNLEDRQVYITQDSTSPVALVTSDSNQVDTEAFVHTEGNETGEITYARRAEQQSRVA